MDRQGVVKGKRRTGNQRNHVLLVVNAGVALVASLLAGCTNGTPDSISKGEIVQAAAAAGLICDEKNGPEENKFAECEHPDLPGMTLILWSRPPGAWDPWLLGSCANGSVQSWVNGIQDRWLKDGLVLVHPEFFANWHTYGADPAEDEFIFARNQTSVDPILQAVGDALGLEVTSLSQECG